MANPFMLQIAQLKPSLDVPFVDALIHDNKAFGGTSNVQAVLSGNGGAVVIFNASANNVLSFVYGIQATTDTALVGMQLEAIAAAPGGYTAINSQAKRRKSAGGAVPTLAMSYSINAAAPTAANVTDAFIMSAGGLNQYFGEEGDIFLEPGTGMRVYFAVTGAASAFKFSVNLDWVEWSTQ